MPPTPPTSRLSHGGPRSRSSRLTGGWPDRAAVIRKTFRTTGTLLSNTCSPTAATPPLSHSELPSSFMSSKAPIVEKALAEQMPHFLEIMGGHRTADDLQASYLTGTIDDMLSTIDTLRDAGLQYLILTPLVDDPRQLELITRHIVEPLS